jgi:hypothetical protein
MSEFTGRDHDNALVRPYVLATDRGDPGPVPEVVEPHPTGVVLVVDGHTRLEVTSNIGHTGLTGLTVIRGETGVTVALPPPTVDALRLALAEATPIPYLPAARGIPESAEGGGRR